MTALRQPMGLRTHLAKYNIDNPARLRFRTALATLLENESAFRLALDEVTGPPNGSAYITEDVARQVRTALRLLVEGPKGEFR